MTQSKLLNQVRNVIRLKQYSTRTEQAYIKWIRNYILFRNKKNPREMGKSEIETHVMEKNIDVVVSPLDALIRLKK